jgi:hypothetical protein
VKDRERVKLLFGPYQAPRLRKGERAACLFRDCDVIVTGWTDVRISWPRCRRPYPLVPLSSQGWRGGRENGVGLPGGSSLSRWGRPGRATPPQACRTTRPAR